MPKKYASTKEAIELIKRNGGTVAGKVISHKNPGLTTLGAIDFLVNWYGYRHVK